MPLLSESELKRYIRDIPDFPQKGILFKDITPLLKNAKALHSAIEAMAKPFQGKRVDQVVGIESRGFIFSPLVAYQLKAGFVPVRKAGKLPHRVEKVSYELEYGKDSLEIHQDAFESGDHVLIVDDLLATGGTARAAHDLVGRAGGKTIGFSFLVELTFLKGREKLAGNTVYSLLKY